MSARVLQQILADKDVVITVRDVISAGDEAIKAFGLNPWCMNEGLASGDEPVDWWNLLHDDDEDDNGKQIAALKAENQRLKLALKRSVPWLGRLIADGGHLNCVAPNDAVGALEQAEAALKGGAA